MRVYYNNNNYYNYSVLVLVLLVGLQMVFVIDAQRNQWYFTGQMRNDRITQSMFTSQRIDVLGQFFDGYKHAVKGSSSSESSSSESSSSSGSSSSSSYFLYFGGVAARLVSCNSSLDDDTLKYLRKQYRSSSGNDNDNDGYHGNMDIRYVNYFDLRAIIDYASATNTSNKNNDVSSKLFAAEVGLYNFRTETFSDQYWYEKKLGQMIAIVVDFVPSDGNDKDGGIERNWYLINVDIRGYRSLVFHTWQTILTVNDNNLKVGEINDKNDIQLSVMTYNLWHNNPPSWVWRNPRERWQKYEQRMRHFADVVIAEDPDVVLLQEVRLDPAFSQEVGGRGTIDAGSQIEHLLSHLIQARSRNLSAKQIERQSHHYHVAFQPAMSMIAINQFGQRLEEGIAILSKFPIVQAETLLLPRTLDDKSDDHQRAVLRVRVALPTADLKMVEVDFMTTHLSLSSSARDHSAAAIRRFTSSSAIENTATRIGEINVDKIEGAVVEVGGNLSFPIREIPVQHEQNCTIDWIVEVDGTSVERRQCHDRVIQVEDASSNLSSNDETSPDSTASSCEVVPSNLLQILTGDLNAEPHESSIDILFRGATVDTTASLIEDTSAIAFHDLWLHNRDIKKQAGDEVDEFGLTFPACDPVKRIDFIFLGRHHDVCNHNSHVEKDVFYLTPELKAQLQSVDVVGLLPSADTVHLVKSREGLGMTDVDSPTWASDHFAVVARFSLKTSDFA